MTSSTVVIVILIVFWLWLCWGMCYWRSSTLECVLCIVCILCCRV